MWLRLVWHLGLRLRSYHTVLRGLLAVSRASGCCAGFISHVMHSGHSLRHTRNQGRQALARLHVPSLLLLLLLLLRMLLRLRLLWWLLRRLWIWMRLAIASRVLLVRVHVHAVALAVGVGCLLLSVVVYAVRSVLCLRRGRMAGVLEVLLRRDLRVHRGHIRAFLPLVDV